MEFTTNNLETLRQLSPHPTDYFFFAPWGLAFSQSILYYFQQLSGRWLSLYNNLLFMAIAPLIFSEKTIKKKTLKENQEQKNQHPDIIKPEFLPLHYQHLQLKRYSTLCNLTP
jgi:hypothetical protein